MPQAVKSDIWVVCVEEADRGGSCEFRTSHFVVAGCKSDKVVRLNDYSYKQMLCASRCGMWV